MGCEQRPRTPTQPAVKPIQFEGLPVTLTRRRGQRKLRIALRNGGIAVSGPWWVSHNDLLAFLDEQRDWVRKSLEKKERRTRELIDNHQDHLPDLLYLGVSYPVIVTEDATVRQGHVHIDVVGPNLLIRYPEWNADHLLKDEHREEIRRVINLWLNAKAKNHLTRRTHELADSHGFSFDRLFIRNQTTKWGTCSTKRNISLNRRLIQCPEFVIDYLIIHELCHLIEMNHSPKYWKLVAQHDPNYLEAEKWLKRYGSVVFSNY